jgi:competence protein ComEC
MEPHATPPSRPLRLRRVPPRTIIPVTLLKVEHHGRRTSTTSDVFRTAPREAIISVGRRNTFSHPGAEILVRIAQAHTRLYRTDEFGLTRFCLTPNGAITQSDNQQQPAWFW